MKAIIQCYTPEEVERIARGEQTVKVCKTAPKETPFKVYMYCTNDKHYEIAQIRFSDGLFIKHISENTNWANGCTANIGEILNGKVVGEYMCERVEKIPAFLERTEGTCLTVEQLDRYGYNKKGELAYLHISAVKIYDEPKELGEFKKYNRTCKFSDLGYAIPNCKTCRDCNLTRPPQPWQYVIGDR